MSNGWDTQVLESWAPRGHVRKDDRAAMVAELQRLRRGHGLHATEVMDRVGGRLRAACGIHPGSSPGEGRQRLFDVLGRAVRELPDDLQLPVLAAFGLPPASQQRFLRDRMAWAGEQIRRDPRTAIRRVESGLTLLAEALVDLPVERAPVGRVEDAPGGWYVDALRATLLPHHGSTELLETRRVTSTVAGLTELAVAWSVPAGAAPGARVRVEPLFGGRLVRDESRSTPASWSGRVRLPRPLARGEQWDFQVRVVTAGLLPPYHVLTPGRRCDEFELRANFHGSGLPRWVWELDAVPLGPVREGRATGRSVEPDDVGEVTSRFTNLRPGLSYGLRWAP